MGQLPSGGASLFLRLADFLRLRQIPPSSLVLCAVLAALAVPFFLMSGIVGVVGAAFLALLISAHFPARTTQLVQVDGLTGMMQRSSFVQALDRHIDKLAREDRSTAVFVFEVDRVKSVEERLDRSGLEEVYRTIASRMNGAIRGTDLICRIEGSVFALALEPVDRLDLEAAIQIAARIQQSVADPMSINGTSTYLTVSVGFAMSDKVAAKSGEDMMSAATLALIEAQRSGPAAIRSYSEAMKTRVKSRNNLASEVARALENGEFKPFFQPQISTHSGEISGFETLARWQHPDRGLVPPGEFLPALEAAGLMEKLSEVMVFEAFKALQIWDENGSKVPRVAINFATDDLVDPRLIDRIKFELDRFDFSPDRLVVEVLETVVADRSSEVIVRNLAGLAKLGCCLDLDDFGTGSASITNIRKFSIERIKIDRSFVTRIDADPEQQKMVSAILTMADRLGLETLAEGVETPAERKMLIDLGCGHLQGFGIARPMPFEDTLGWISMFQDRSRNPIQFRRLAH